MARAGDPDRYLAALFAPRRARDALMTLTAFNVELARIPVAVSEPMLGEIRLQWWRDALDEGAATGNPVADALGAAMHTHMLSKPLLFGLIDARSFDLSDRAMPDMPALKAYLQKTAGTLTGLSARILARESPSADGAAREAGLAVGLTGLLRSLPAHRAQGRLYLPATAFQDRGVAPEALWAGSPADGVAEALADLRAEARSALGRARAGLEGLAPETLPAFLPLALVEPYLAAQERPGHQALTELADLSPLGRLGRLAWAAWRGRV